MLHVVCRMSGGQEAQSLPSLEDGRPRANSVLQQVEAKVSIPTDNAFLAAVGALLPKLELQQPRATGRRQFSQGSVASPETSYHCCCRRVSACCFTRQQ